MVCTEPEPSFRCTWSWWCSSSSRCNRRRSPGPGGSTRRSIPRRWWLSRPSRRRVVAAPCRCWCDSWSSKRSRRRPPGPGAGTRRWSRRRWSLPGRTGRRVVAAPCRCCCGSWSSRRSPAFASETIGRLDRPRRRVRTPGRSAPAARWLRWPALGRAGSGVSGVETCRWLRAQRFPGERGRATPPAPPAPPGGGSGVPLPRHGGSCDLRRGRAWRPRVPRIRLGSMLLALRRRPPPEPEPPGLLPGRGLMLAGSVRVPEDGRSRGWMLLGSVRVAGERSNGTIEAGSVGARPLCRSTGTMLAGQCASVLRIGSPAPCWRDPSAGGRPSGRWVECWQGSVRPNPKAPGSGWMVR